MHDALRNTLVVEMRKMPDDWVSCWNVPQSIKTGRLLLWHRLLLGIAAIHPGNLVPGVDVTPDPLLQGRLFSYQDTQLIRLGGPNFHELPVNRAVCPFHNFQRDGHMRSTVAKGRVAYEPNSLDPNGVRENPKAGYRSFPDPDSGPKLRQRAESFADHYSQARQFYRSMTPPEKTNIVRALCFELGKVETTAVRTRMLGHLDLIEPELGRRVAEALGMAGEADKMVPAVQPRDDLDPSQALSLVAKAPKTLQGRTVAVLVTEGSDVRLVDTVRKALGKQKATVKIVAPKAGKMKIGVLPDMTIDGGPSCLFDGIVLLSSADGTETLLDTASAIDWLRDAYAHLKAIGYAAATLPLFEKANLEIGDDAGIIDIGSKDGLNRFIKAAEQHKIWDRDTKVRPPV